MLALLALASSALWGTSDFFAGVRARRVAPPAVVGISQGFALLALTVLVLLRPGDLHFSGWPVWALAAGVSGSLALVSFYTALSTGTMGVVSPIAALGTLVPVLLGVVTGDRPHTIAWAGMALAVAGASLASGPELTGAVSRRPVVLASLSAVGFGFALFALDRGSRVSLLHTLWGMRVVSGVLFLTAALLLRSTGGAGRRDLAALSAIGLGDVSANALFAYASSHGLVSVASVLGSLYPVATLTWAGLLLKERLRRVQQVGVTLALVGVVLMTI